MNRLQLPSSDIEESAILQETCETGAQQVLDRIGIFLDQTDQSLADLDENESNDGLLSSTIMRGSRELALAVGKLAEELDQQSCEERRALAQACVDEMQPILDERNSAIMKSDPHGDASDPAIHSADDENIGTIDENDMIRVIEAAKVFLRDVEASLLLIDQQTAEELADVTLTVARLFVASLQSVYAQITPQDLLDLQNPQRHQSQMDIEILEDESGPVDSEMNGKTIDI